MNTGIADVFKEMIRRKEIEDVLSEEGINAILKSQRIPIQKKGKEFSYQMDPNFSLYTNPAEAGIRYENKFANGGIASAITKIKKNPKVEKYAAGALVPIASGLATVGGAIARSAPTAISKIKDILSGSRKIKDMGRINFSKVDDIADAKIVDDVVEKSGNIFSRNPVTSTLTGLGLTAGVAPSIFGGGKEETTDLGNGGDDGDDGDDGDGGGKPGDLTGVRGETLGVYARKILQQKGFEYDLTTGKFKDGSKPKFLDYLKAFGSGYMEKTAEDPEFAKKMMAGFAAMTMPKEGPVGFSPLGISEFTQGYLGTDLALEEAKPADQKILEYLQQNPDQKNVLNNLERSRLNLDKDDLAAAEEVYITMFGQIAKRDGLPSADAKDFYLVTPDGKPFMQFEALTAFKNLTSEELETLRDSLKLKSI